MELKPEHRLLCFPISAQVCTCMLPHIGALVDHRHQPVYGSAYAITDNAFGLAFAVGESIRGLRNMVDSDVVIPYTRLTRLVTL